MDFQRNMWAEAWVQSVAARNFVALVVFGALAIEGLGGLETGGSFLSTLLWSYLAYAVHAQILLPPDNNAATNALRVIGFALRTFGIVLLITLAVFLSTIIFASVIGTEQSRVVLVFGLVAFVVLGLPVFVWLGTILPAYVAGRERGIGAAVRRGRAQFSWIAVRLLIGPGALLILSLALLSLLLFPVDYNGEFLSEDGDFQPMAVFALFLGFTVQAFATSLTAVILSRAFLRAEGMSETAAA
ncbi:MAG: hypothetical protein AAGA00_02715 [Pseudomonadota bacterium]